MGSVVGANKRYPDSLQTGAHTIYHDGKIDGQVPSENACLWGAVLQHQDQYAVSMAGPCTRGSNRPDPVAGLMLRLKLQLSMTHSNRHPAVSQLSSAQLLGINSHRVVSMTLVGSGARPVLEVDSQSLRPGLRLRFCWKKDKLHDGGWSVLIARQSSGAADLPCEPALSCWQHGYRPCRAAAAP